MNPSGPYEPSGKVGPSVVVMPLLGVLAAVCGAWIYAYVDVYCPIIGYISLIFVAAYGFLVAIAVGAGAQFGKVRSPGVGALMGFLVGLFAVHADFAAFLHVLLAREDFSPGYMAFLADPVLVWDMALGLSETGWYSIASFDVKGVVLLLFWGIEALGIVAVATAIGWVSISDSVFCERCGEWANERDGLLHLALPEDGAELERIRSGDLSRLATMPLVAVEAAKHLRVDTQHCETCMQTVYAQVQLADITVDKDGDASEETEELTELLPITTDLLAKLEARRPEGADADD